MSSISAVVANSPVTRALSVLGDRWTLLILRDAFQGAHRFEQFRTLNGAARSTLTSRLNGLVENGILERVQYSDAPPRFEYRLTEKGLALYGVTLVTWRWEHRWVPNGAGIPKSLRHKVCKHSMLPEVACAKCGERIELRDTTFTIEKPTSRARPMRRAKASALAVRRLSTVNAESHRGANAALLHITDILGDRWTPLVLSAAFLGLRRFDEIQSALEIATNILTHRLNLLVEHEILQRERYSERPPRFEYRLTQKGRDLYPHALMLMQWGERWLPQTNGPTMRIVHKKCGAKLEPVVTCNHCHGVIDPHDISFPTAASAKKRS
ncbi:MAG TPA: helix-turn-helix domain-containing protein [Steroidobacteraceae bacterium]